MPQSNETSESTVVQDENTESTVDSAESSGEQLSNDSSLLDGNPEGSPYYVGTDGASSGVSVLSDGTTEEVGTDVYSQDFEQIHAYLEAQHSQQVLALVLLAAIFGTLMVKFFFDRLKG